MEETLILLFIVFIYTVIGYIYLSLSEISDGIRRFVIALLFGWAIIPLFSIYYAVKGVFKFIAWLFRLS